MNNYDLNAEADLIYLLICDNSLCDNVKLEKEDFFDEKNWIVYEVIKQAYKKWKSFAEEFAYSNALFIQCAKECWYDEETCDKIVLWDYYRHEVVHHHDAYIHLSKAISDMRVLREQELIQLRAKNEKWSFDKLAEELMKLKSYEKMIEQTNADIDEEYDRELELRQSKKWFVSIGHVFPKLDRAISLRKWYMCTMAGKSGTGKTTTALNISLAVAEQWHKVVFFSMEMERTLIHDKIFWHYGNINISDLMNGKFNKESERLISARNTFKSLRWFEVISFANKLSDIKSYLNANRDTDCVVIDYIGLMHEIKSSGNKGWVEAMKELTFELKGIATSYDVVVIALSQTGKKAERDNLNISDMYGAGSLENDSDIVMLINKLEDNSLKIEIAKNRHWSTWFVMFNNKPEIGTIEEKII